MLHFKANLKNNQALNELNHDRRSNGTDHLTDKALFEDQSDQYPNNQEPYAGDYIKLSDELIQKVKSLRDQIPK